MGEMLVRSYTVDEARKIVMKCAKEYNRNLAGKKFIIIYRDKVDNGIKFFEIYFGKPPATSARPPVAQKG